MIMNNELLIDETIKEKLKNILEKYFNLSEKSSISEIDGRNMAAAFRRFDIVEGYLKNQEWWDKNLS